MYHWDDFEYIPEGQKLLLKPLFIHNIERYVFTLIKNLKLCWDYIKIKKRGLQYIYSERVVRRCSVKKVFLEISQNLMEKTVPEFLFN